MAGLKPVILSSVVFVALATTTAITTAASAQKGTSLTPSTKWSVLDVYNEEKPEHSYCAVAKRFKPNTVLTLAKNKKSEASLALDFQQSRFDTSKAVKVTMDPGAGQQRSYDISPASPQAIVVRFGQDETFFDALAKTGYLRVELEDMSMNFDLADIDSGQGELGKCLTNLSASKTIAQESGDGVYGAEAYKAAAPGSDSLKHVETLKNRVDYLTKENERLSQLTAEVEKKQKSGEISDGKEDLVQELLQSVDSLKAENEALRAKGSAGGGDDQAVVIAKLEEEIGNLKLVNEEITAQLAKPVKVPDVKVDNSEQLAILNAEIDSLKAENKRLQEDLSKEDKDGQTIKPVASINAELETLKKQNEQLKAQALEAEKSGETIKTLTADLQAVMKENQALKSGDSAQSTTVAQTSETQKKLEQDLAQAKAKLEVISKDNEALKVDVAKMESLKAEIEALKAKKSELQVALAEQARDDVTVSKLGDELTLLKKENLDLQEKVALADKAKLDREEMDKKLAALEGENKGLKEKIDAASKVEAQVASLNAQITSLKAENEATKIKISEKDKEKETALAAVQTEIQTLKLQNEDLKTQVAKQGESEAKIISLNTDVKILRDENVGLKTKLDLAQADSTKLAALGVEIQTIKTENESLKTAMKAQGETEAKIVDLNTQITALKQENEKLKTTTEQQTGEVAKLAVVNAELAAVKSENETLKKASESKVAAEEKVKTLEVELAAVKSENETLKKDSQSKLAAEEKAKTLETQMSTLKTEKEALAAAKDSEGKEFAALKEKLAKLEADNKSLSEKIESVDKKDDSLMLSSLEAEQQRLRDENADMKVKLGMLSEGEQAITQMKDKLEALQKENDGLELALEKAQKKAKEKAESLRVAQEEKVPPVPRARPEAVAAVLAEEVSVVSEQGSGDPELDHITAREKAGGHVEKLAQAEKSKGFDEVLSGAVAAPQDVKVTDDLPREGMTEAQYQDMLLAKKLKGEGVSSQKVSPSPKALSAVIKEEVLPPQPVAHEVLPSSGQENIVVQAVPEKATPPKAPQSSERVAYYAPGVRVHDLLSEARIVDGGAIRLVQKASGQERVAYQWKAQGVYGSSEQVPLQNPAQFDYNVKAYLQKTQSRCSGDFAVIPEQSMEYGGTRVDSYEVACVGGGVNSSASLLFFSGKDTFTILTHEAPVENMETTMTFRDRVLLAIRKLAA